MDYETDYDVLLDDYDEGLTTDEVRTVFDELKRELVPLIAQIAENADGSDDSSLHGDFPIEKQRAFALEDARAVRLRPRGLAARPDGAPVRDERRHDRTSA